MSKRILTTGDTLYSKQVLSLINDKEKFDNYIYNALIQYLKNSWYKKYIIPIPELIEYYKFFYTNLLREEVKELFIIFIQQYKQLFNEFNFMGFFEDIFINNILPEYMRNNAYIGNYITYTNNFTSITSSIFKKCFIFIKNNNKIEENKRSLFIYTADDDYSSSGHHKTEYIMEHDSDIVSVVSNDDDGLFLDMRNNLYHFKIISKRGSPKLEKNKIEFYKEEDKNYLSYISDLTIISIYIGREYYYFIDDKGEVYEKTNLWGTIFRKIKFIDSDNNEINHPRITLLSLSYNATFLVDNENKIYISSGFYRGYKTDNIFILLSLKLSFDNRIISISSAQSNIVVNVFNEGFYNLKINNDIINIGKILKFKKYETLTNINNILSFDSFYNNEGNDFTITTENDIYYNDVDSTDVDIAYHTPLKILRIYRSGGYSSKLYILTSNQEIYRIKLYREYALKIYPIQNTPYNKYEEIGGGGWKFECYICKNLTTYHDIETHKFFCNTLCQSKYEKYNK